MKTTNSQNLLAVALVGALTATIAQAQTDSLNYRRLTLAPDEPTPAGGGGGADDTAELAKKLQNPIASLISVPIQNNFDFGGGPKGDGFQYKVNVQPVIPFSLGEDWNVITRTILPIIHQENIIGTTSQSGLSDLTESLFFSPKMGFHGWTWGAGPVFLFPTATDKFLGAEKYGAGPTMVALKQEHGWTYGALVNHIWSYAGADDRGQVNATFLQPFLVYTFPTHTSVALNTESTYNWDDHQWTVPIHLTAKQVVKIGGAPVQFEFGPRYYAEGPKNGPAWGLRFTVTLLFPK